FRTAFVGFNGPEPSVGVDAEGRIFLQALLRTMRSEDNGASWLDVTAANGPVVTFDPYIWVDRDTGRVYNDQLIFAPGGAGCSWAAWTDTAGAAPLRLWEGDNVRFCSAVPEPLFVDHQKVHTGPIPPNHILAHPPGGVNPLVLYPNAVFFAWNTGSQGKIAMSLDGGLTFPVQAFTVGNVCDGGLHGRVRSFSTGEMIIPKRDCNRPLVLITSSFSAWEALEVGNDAGSSEHRKNPDVAIDTADNAYLFWSGADEGIWMSRTADKGSTWDAVSTKVSPPHIGSTAMPSSVAGSPGRMAVMYYGTDDDAEAPDHVADTARWHAYITFSLNALDADPTFVTIQLDTDANPIQIGCVSTRLDGHCANQNLLDFTDLVLTPDGRVVAAYADGCTVGSGCADNPAATNLDSTDSDGTAAIQLVGPAMLVGADAPAADGLGLAPEVRASLMPWLSS
ncbi:MAG TPA: hypothetical protein VGR28_04305, partial [Candidatus Thermoplasmatota archaeon]|nr:hypothetical protein [Candidatus Thermoplasmatota archaeon]